MGVVRENPVEKDGVELARSLGYISRKTRYIGRTSCADRGFFGHCRYVLVEFKRPGGRMTAKQVEEFKRIRRSGYTDVHCVDSLVTLRNILMMRT